MWDSNIWEHSVDYIHYSQCWCISVEGNTFCAVRIVICRSLRAKMLCSYVNNADNLHYAHGKVKFSSQKHDKTPIISTTTVILGAGLVTKIKTCAPHFHCNNYTSHLRNWINGNGHSMHFNVPMTAISVWCLVFRKRLKKKKKVDSVII